MTDLAEINSPEELKEATRENPVEVRNYQTFKSEFDEEIKKAADSYVRIGFLLKEARDTGILQGSGYTTMSDFAKAEYGLSPDQTSRFINVYERFGDGEGHLKVEYKDHGQTKLIEMLSLPDVVAEVIPADISREAIREIKQEIKEEQQITPIERTIEKSDIPEGLNDLETFIYIHLKNPENFRKYWKEMQTTPADDPEKILRMFDSSGVVIITERLPRRGRFLLSFRGIENKPNLVDVMQDVRTEIDWIDLYTAMSGRLYPEDTISDTVNEDYEMSYGPMESDAKSDTVQLSREPEEKEESEEIIPAPVTEEPKEVAITEEKPAEDKEEGSNIETDEVIDQPGSSPEEVINPPEEEEKEEIAPAQVEESLESQSATNFEHESVEAQQVKEEDPEPSSDESVEEITEIERAQFMNPPAEDEDTYYSKAKKAAAALDSELFRFMKEYTDQYPMASEIQDQMDRIEEKVAEWRNIMIAWRKSRETM